MLSKLMSLAVVLFLSSVALAEEGFDDFEDRFVNLMESYREGKLTDTGGLDALIDDILKYSSNPAHLEPIEQFTLPYYLGYLHYVSGLSQSDSVSFQKAKGKFRAAVRAYKVNLPDKKVFAVYMQAWCDLRIFLTSNASYNIEFLTSAIKILDGLAAKNSTSEFKRDIYFLRGFAHYLIAKVKYEKIEEDLPNLRQAIDDFGQSGAGDDKLAELSHFYTAAGRFLRSKYPALSKLRDRPATVAREAIIADADSSRGVFSTLASYGNVATYNWQLASINKQMSGQVRIGSGEPFIEGNRAQFADPLLQEYFLFLNYLGEGKQAVPFKGSRTSELKFWHDLRVYLQYLSQYAPGSAAALDANLFLNVSVTDWRSDHFAALTSFYRKESLILQNRFINIDNTLDDAFLMKFHRDRNRFLDDFIRLRGMFGNNPDIARLDSVRQIIEMSAVATNFQNVFGVERQRMVDFANYFLALAVKNRNLYPVAYMAYDQAGRLGYNTEHVTLLKAYCELKHINDNSRSKHHAVLAALEDNNLSGWSQGNKNEAIFYRAMIHYKITGSLLSREVGDALERVRDNHPEAGYKLAYEMDNQVRVRNHGNMDLVYEQCRKNPELLAKLLASCEGVREREAQRQQGTPWKPQPPQSYYPVEIGDEAIRYDRLQRLGEIFPKREKQFLVNYWKVLSAPLQKPSPGDGSKTSDFLGPLEFFTGNKIKIHLALGKPGKEKHLTISYPTDGCRKFTTSKSDMTLEVRALRTYTFVASVDGYYPRIVNRKFKDNGEVLEIEYDQALESADSSSEEADLRLDSTNGFYIASVAYDNSLNVYNSSGNAVLKENGGFSAVTSIGERYYVLSRLKNEIRELLGTKFNKLKKFDDQLLNQPSDLAGIGQHLFVVNSGDNTVLKFDLANGDMAVAKVERAGRLESIVVTADRVFVTDWMENSIWVSDWNNSKSWQFRELPDVRAAQDSGMVVPGKISILHHDSFVGQYFAVTGMVSNKLFIFHITGKFLGTVSFDGQNVSAPRIVSLAGSTTDRRLEIFHALGISKNAVRQRAGYKYPVDCGGQQGQSAESPDAGYSRFGLLMR